MLAVSLVAAAVPATAVLSLGTVNPATAKGGAGGGGGGGGGGGTAKPPANAPAVAPPAHPVNNGLAAAATTGPVADLHQFDVTGFIQAATVDGGSMCPTAPPAARGGTLTVNGVVITVPCWSVVQMPANTLSWADAVDLTSHANLALNGGSAPYPSFEAHVVGNMVGAAGSTAPRHVAGLVFLSQQAANSGQGIITRIDYATGELYVGSAKGAADQVRLQINDPHGRFGRAQSPDDRFSVDDQNPTIHAGTGYPMCVPRVTQDPTLAGRPDDPLCPQRNRPLAATQQCRNLTAAGVSPLPKGGDVALTPTGEKYCRGYVMKAYFDPTWNPNTDPDPRQQVPFEVGDYITYAGTLMKGAGPGPDYVSVHTIEASLGVYTQPGTQPAYTSIGEFGIGSADPALFGINGAAQEAADRIFLEAQTTDVETPVDIYLVDLCPGRAGATWPMSDGVSTCQAGSESNRWITPYEMTGELNLPYLDPVNGVVVGGGIDTMMTGGQMQRARLRATKAPLGFLVSPTRTIRVVQRTACLPPKAKLGGAPALSMPMYPVTLGSSLVPAIDTTVAEQGFGATGTGTFGATGRTVPCSQRMKVANGLTAGVYTAPTFEFIFPENTVVGQTVVPNNLWDLGFLTNGEGPGTDRLAPTPW